MPKATRTESENGDAVFSWDKNNPQNTAIDEKFLKLVESAQGKAWFVASAQGDDVLSITIKTARNMQHKNLPPALTAMENKGLISSSDATHLQSEMGVRQVMNV